MIAALRQSSFATSFNPNSISVFFPQLNFRNETLLNSDAKARARRAGRTNRSRSSKSSAAGSVPKRQCHGSMGLGNVAKKKAFLIALRFFWALCAPALCLYVCFNVFLVIHFCHFSKRRFVDGFVICICVCFWCFFFFEEVQCSWHFERSVLKPFF